MNASFPRASGPLQLAAALALIAASAACAAQSVTYSIDVYSIGSGSDTLANACFRLAGTIADAAPGVSANGTYTAYAGFWGAATPARAVDEVFFTGFEEC